MTAFPLSLTLVRNATIILKYAGHRILIDPMLSPKDTFPPFGGKARNPLVGLPMPVEEIVRNTDLVLVTHTHPDHYDQAAANALDPAVELLYQPADEALFPREKFENARVVESSVSWKNIRIDRTYAQHGSGEVLDLMGYASGFVLRSEGQPTIYLVGDGIWTEEIRENIRRFEPDILVLNAGGAVKPGYEATPILMNETDTVAVLAESGNATVIAVHLEALDHCLTTRASLRQAARQHGIPDSRLLIPADGETISLY